MIKKTEAKKENKIKQLFLRVLEKLDKKMEEKAKSQSSCCKPGDKGKNSCCN